MRWLWCVLMHSSTETTTTTTLHEGYIETRTEAKCLACGRLL